MVYFVLFLHDYVTVRIILNKQVNELVYLASNQEQYSTEAEIQLLLDKHLIICKTKDVISKVEKGLFYYSGTITADIRINTTLTYVNELLGQNQSKLSVTTQATCIRGNKVLVPIAAVDEISDKVPKIGEVKKKYLDKFNETIKYLIEGRDER